MKLYKEILANILLKEEMQVTFPNLSLTSGELVEMRAYEALEEIKAIVEDNSLSDFQCVEEIVRILEDVGSDGGSRHDF